MKSPSFITFLVMVFITSLFACSDKDATPNLLVNIQWFAKGGTTSLGYATYSPLYFQINGKLQMGSAMTTWRYADGGHSIIVGDGNTKTKFEIISLTEKVFHFKHFDHSGNLAADLTYDKCGSQIVLGQQNGCD